MAEGPVAPLSGRLGGLRPVLGEMGRISISIESPSSLTFPKVGRIGRIGQIGRMVFV